MRENGIDPRLARATQGPQPVAEMRIFLMNDGNIVVHGPLENKAACWAMIGGAVELVTRHKPPEVAVAPPGSVIH